MVNFKQLLEKATNGDLSEPDWETILEIVEEVKTKNVSAKNAIKEFRKRLLDSSGNVVYHTLQALDSLMKNCASDVHSEVLSVEFMGVMKTVVTSNKGSSSVKAVDKALELIGEWKTAFGDQTGYKAVNTIFAELEREGFHIPMSQVASAAFIKKPPEWTLGDRCFMCRQEFNRFKGKLRHHCRNCGKSVCAPCSGKRVALPHFGVVEATRVCDICYKKVEKGEGASAAATASEMDNDLPVEYLRSSLAQESQVPSSSSGSGRGAGPSGGAEQQLQEEDDLQMAIAMSLNEQENKAKKPSSSSSAPRRAPSLTPSVTTAPSAPPPTASTLYASIIHDHPPEPAPSYAHQQPPVSQSQPAAETSTDPLARYLDRNYWEQRKEQQASGIPPPASTTATHVGPQATAVAQAAVVTQNGANNTLAQSINTSIDMFVKRLHEVNSGGGSIATDPVVLSLYQNLTAMQPQLLKQIDDLQQQKAKQLGVLHKLNEAKEARVTLNKMRRDHQDKVKQMEQEQAMLARMQMEQKLALLRQQKQEQLAFQQTLQSKRLETLNSQRVEYQNKVAFQREMERQQLIAQEQKVLQHQFGSGASGMQPQQQQQQQQQPTQLLQQQQQQVGGYGVGTSPGEMRKLVPPVMPPAQQFSSLQHETQPTSLDPSSGLPLHSLSLQDPGQALPLPPKAEYNPTPPPPGGVDPMAPPPYNPSSMPQDPAAMYNSYQVPPPSSSSSGPSQYQPALQAPSGFDPHQQLHMSAQLNSMQPSSMQPSSMQPSSMQPSGMQPMSLQQPLSLQQQQQQPASLQQVPPNVGMGPNVGGVATMQPSGYGGVVGVASNPSLPSQSSGTFHTSVSPPQAQQQGAGNVGNFAPMSAVGGPGQGQQHQQQQPPSQVQQFQDPSGMPPQGIQPYTAGYQGYQQPPPQQQQQTAEGFIPNGGGHPPRRESETPLISFD